MGGRWVGTADGRVDRGALDDDQHDGDEACPKVELLHRAVARDDTVNDQACESGSG